MVIKADIPDQINSFWDVFRGDWQRSLDLTIDVPIGTPLDINDGSGDLTVRGTGPVTLEDGSGDVEISGVGGTMHISEKGSGGVRVSRVGGDFVVDSKGSGSIDYDTVKGSVNIPERKRERYRR